MREHRVSVSRMFWHSKTALSETCLKSKYVSRACWESSHQQNPFYKQEEEITCLHCLRLGRWKGFVPNKRKPRFMRFKGCWATAPSMPFLGSTILTRLHSPGVTSVYFYQSHLSNPSLVLTFSGYFLPEIRNRFLLYEIYLNLLGD